MFAALNSFLTRAVSGYFLNKSLRFRSSASAYLSRTPATATNQKTWTWSGWVKRGTLGAVQAIFAESVTGYATYFTLSFASDDTIGFDGDFGGTRVSRKTASVFRDPSAWYHVVFVLDTTQATDTNRVLLYINGVNNPFSTPGFSTWPVQNTNGGVNTTQAHNIGRRPTDNDSYCDLELAEVNFVDGQALAPTAFGATGANSQWLPKAYAGTYGTNGFYLPFSGGTATSYAGSFNGSSQYLSAPANAALAMGTGDFTLECWIYALSANDNGIFENRSNGVSNDGFTITALSSSIIRVYTNSAIIASSGTVYLNIWTHIAVVRYSGTTTLYINGVSVGTSVSMSNCTNSDAIIAGGRYSATSSVNSYFPGYISNFRFVKGTAVYTANFIPPTAALTAITNTSLLTLQNATIVDNSTNAFTITNNGTVVTSVQSPFLNPTVLTADSSGNANNWTPNNISLTAGSTYDSLTDVPTLTSTTVANYAVLNPLDKSPSLTISNGNLTQYTTATTYQYGVRSSIRVSSGKWYWETFIVNRTSGIIVGINGTSLPMGENDNAFAATPSYGYNSVNGNKFVNGVSSAYGASYTSNAVIGIALDMDAGTLTFYKDNVSQGTAATGISGSFAACNATWNSELNANFGQQPFTYTPPSGFLPLNTYNI